MTLNVKEIIKTKNLNTISKSTYIYEITESRERINGKVIVTYGISIDNRHRELAEKDGEHCRIDGISPDYEKVKQLKALIEEMELFPVHLHDVVEDFLS